MLKQIFLHQVGRAINRVLQTDPLAFADLKKLAGKSVLIEIVPLTTALYLSLTPHGVQLAAHQQETASIKIRGKAWALMKFLKSTDHTQLLMDEHVSLQGEIDVLLKLKQLAAKTQLDLEGLIATYIGDNAANRLGLLSKRVAQHAKASYRSVKTSTTLYLQEESQWLPTPFEVEQFIQDIQQLRQDMDRLQARIQRLPRVSRHV